MTTLQPRFWAHPAIVMLADEYVGAYCRLLSWAAENGDGSTIPTIPNKTVRELANRAFLRLHEARLLVPADPEYTGDWMLVTDLDAAAEAAKAAMEQERAAEEIARVEAIYNGEKDPKVVEREERRQEAAQFDADMRLAVDLLREARTAHFDDPRVRSAVDTAIGVLDEDEMADA